MIKLNSEALAAAPFGTGILRWLGWGKSTAVLVEAAATDAAASGECALSRLLPGEHEVVCRVAGAGPIRQRLLELGVTPGATVEVIRFAPLGDPMEVRVRGYHLSLRRREAEAIWVRREDGERDRCDTPGAAARSAGGQSQ